MPAFREQHVRFPFDDDAARVDRAVRERQLDVLRGVPLDEWARPSRCAGWSVHDVVRHVVQMNEVMVGTAAAVRSGERYDRMRGFDARTTPSAWLAEAPRVDPQETLVAFERSTQEVIDAGAALAADVLVGSPAGRQPWARVQLHALFDVLVHERDVTEPLGRSAPATPDQLPVLAYALLLAARIACMADREFAVPLDLGGQTLAVAVRGADVAVDPVTEPEDAVAADPLRLLDGLSGRVPLADVLPADDHVRAALRLLARSL